MQTYLCNNVEESYQVCNRNQNETSPKKMTSYIYTCHSWVLSYRTLGTKNRNTILSSRRPV